jgi:hypothetical protein
LKTLFADGGIKDRNLRKLSRISILKS